MKNSIISKVKNKTWDFCHYFIKKQYKSNYCRRDPITIISCNCIGGVLYHALDLKFSSPTINLFMTCEDFIKFCERLPYYLSVEIKPYSGEIHRDYPLGSLDDIVLYFVHYNSYEEAKKKWEQRVARINWENIYIIATDRDGFSLELLDRFLNLPYQNKKIFCHKEYLACGEIVYIRGFENEQEVGGLMSRTQGGHYLIDQFDWVNWFNGHTEEEA